MLRKLDKWHKRKQGLFVFGVIEGALGYIFASLALNSGSLLQWFFAIVLLFGSVQNFVKLVILVTKKG